MFALVLSVDVDFRVDLRRGLAIQQQSDLDGGAAVTREKQPADFESKHGGWRVFLMKKFRLRVRVLFAFRMAPCLSFASPAMYLKPGPR